MRFYTETHEHSCGIDLHAKTMYVCILDRDGQVVLHKNMKSRPETCLADARLLLAEVDKVLDKNLSVQTPKQPEKVKRRVAAKRSSSSTRR